MKITRIQSEHLTKTNAREVKIIKQGTHQRDFVSPNFMALMIPTPMKMQETMGQVVQNLNTLSPEVLRSQLDMINQVMKNALVAQKMQVDVINNASGLFKLLRTHRLGAAAKEFAQQYQIMLSHKENIEKAFSKRLESIKELASSSVNSADAFRNSFMTGTKALKEELESIDTFRNLKGFAALAGYDKEKNLLNNSIISLIKSEREGHKLDIPGSILFFGPQGNGKSTFAEAFAHEADCEVEFINVEMGRDSDKIFYTELQKAANEAKAKFESDGELKNKRTILIIDEFDQVAGKNSRYLSEIDSFLKNCSKEYHCTVFATTNYPEKLKLNFEKDYIFPFRVGVDPSTIEDKAKILEFYMNGRNKESIDFLAVAQKIDEREKEEVVVFSNAFLKQAALNSKSEEDLLINLAKIQPNIGKNEIENYQKAFKLLARGKMVF